MSGPWRVERWRGTAAELHERRPPPLPGPRAWVCEVVAPALVLGSSQPDAVVAAGAARRAGVAVVRRRSGGGAVLLVPGEHVWLDVVLPADDPRWVDDVGRSSAWLGAAWAAALAEAGVRGPVAHHGPWRPDALGRLVCFAGRGPGEVVDAAGAKVVGLSQRRTRGWARFQCLVHVGFDPAAALALLDPALVAATGVADPVAELGRRVAAVGPAGPAALEGLLRRLA